MSNKYEDLIKNARVNAECGEHMSPAEVTTLLNVVETTLAALAAENAGLKSAVIERKNLSEEIRKAGRPPHTDFWHQSIYMADKKVDDALNSTLATDAFLAEVRAQVWIEGNEPAEFGRYWVRYETDAGPQYCSAKWMEHNFCSGSDSNIHKIWLADHSRSINSLRGVTHYTKLPDSLEAAQ
ncbi:hypothetical protein RMR26_12510 [Enterobacter cloacae]|uniref:hypothetical protein n=1 Tax=Enterobacter cloacae TaxID=550 RepID=UPI002888AB7B|nr:hypothetical protein [Enterobacter cloacae]MDT0535834.1 hypothetical protein [Enterobacter cloacae]